MRLGPVTWTALFWGAAARIVGAPTPTIVTLTLPAETEQQYPLAVPSAPEATLEVDLPWTVADWAGRGFTPDPDKFAGDFLVDAVRGSPRLFVTPLVRDGHRVLHVVVAPPGTAERTVLLEFLPAPAALAWHKLIVKGEPGEVPTRPPPQVIRRETAPSAPYAAVTPRAELGLLQTMRLVHRLSDTAGRDLLAASPTLLLDRTARRPRSFGDFTLQVQFALRDATDDLLGLCVEVRNATASRLLFEPDSWIVRVGDWIYPVKTIDFLAEVEPGAAQLAWLILTPSADGTPTRLLPSNDFQVSARLAGKVNPRPVLRFPLAGETPP